MGSRYRIDNSAEIITPALVVFRTLVEQNLDRMVRMAGDAGRLCPHCKSHKMAAVIQLELERGITHHKCATLAEAEMLAEAGVQDIFLAYNLVGPNIMRAVSFRQQYPRVRLSVTVDDPKMAVALDEAMVSSGQEILVYLDLDTGLQRTGLPVGDSAADLYQILVESPGLQPAGLHVYDGQNHQESYQRREAAVRKIWDQVVPFRDRLRGRGWPVPRIVGGGTGSFPAFAKLDDPTLLLSPGTCVFHDARYEANFPDLGFVPAALLLTRVVSKPTADRITLDVGNKAVASDPPAEQRLVFPDLPDAKLLLHNEEHLVVETAQAHHYRLGDPLLAIPGHICPTSALHKQAYVVVDGSVSDRWDVTARDRWLTI